MNHRRYLIGALVLLAFANASPAGEPIRTPKNPKNPPPVLIPPPPLKLPKNRIGILATGGMNFETEFTHDHHGGKDPKSISDAYTKDDPSKSIEEKKHKKDKKNGYYDEHDSGDDDFSAGVEIFYERVFSDPASRHLWGLRLGVGYNEVEIDGGAGILDHKLDADLVYLNIGPFYEHRFTDQFYGSLSAGLTAAYINSDLSSESVGAILDETSEDDFLFGAYASASIGYDFSPRWGILGGVRYQYLDNHEIKTDAGEAELEFDSSVYAFIGLRFIF